jgi:hypothetical protein
MPLPVIADTLRVSLEGVMPNGHLWANVLHYRKSGALSYAGAIAVLDPLMVRLVSFNFAAASSWASNAPTTWSVQRVRYTPLDGVSATTVIGHVIPGTNGNEPLPANIALVVTKYTALRGRANRGRVYMSGHTEDGNLPPGVVNPVTLGRHQANWNGHLADLVGSGVSLVVASYLPPAVANDVTTVVINARWDTQRRRQNT